MAAPQLRVNWVQERLATDTVPGFPRVAAGITFTKEAVPLPQELEGVTETFPDPEPTVTEIELLVLEPDQPDGNDQA